MKSALREPFSSGAKCTAMKPFTFAGKRYKVGQEFHWRRLACSERKAKQLWESRLITCGEAAPERPKPKGNVIKTMPLRLVAQEQTTEVTPEVT
jgi:hypothetical protein